MSDRPSVSSILGEKISVFLASEVVGDWFRKPKSCRYSPSVLISEGWPSWTSQFVAPNKTRTLRGNGDYSQREEENEKITTE